MADGDMWGMIGSCNVAGLTNEKMKLFKTNFENFEVMCLQETHGTEKNCKSRIAKLGFQKGIFSLHQKAIRGSAILWRESVKQIGNAWQDPDGRIAAVVLQKEDGPKTLFVSVYAPNVDPSPASQSNYISFLISLEHVLSEMTRRHNVDQVMMLGDFNIICDPELDSLSVAPKLYKIPVEALQEVLTRAGLFDAFRTLYLDERCFTFSRRGLLQKNGDRAPPIMNRLDYAFVRQNTLSMIRVCEHRNTALTDHKLIVLDLREEDGGTKRKLGLWKHNDLLNKDTSFVKMMKEKLENFIPIAQNECSSNKGAWEAIKCKSREWSREFSINKMRQERAEKKALWEKLQNTSSKPSLAERQLFSENKAKYDEICKREAQRLIFRAKVESLQNDEKFSKFFFLKIRHNRAQSNITKLKVGDALEEDQSRVNAEIKRFYKELYKTENPEEPDLDWLNRVQKMSNEESKVLERPLTGNEFSNVLFKHMKVGKSPGNDGLTVEFYRTFWKELREPLIKALREALSTGELSASQKQSVIRLIPKKNRDLAQVKNWRPISLMNVDVKILSKALNFRIEKYLAKITSKEQTAFVKGRLLQDNTSMIGQAIEYSCKHKRQAQIFSIDFKKAFDSLEHGYLWKVMRSMNFGETFISMIKTLYNRAESTVMNNGVTVGYFPLQRAARQGDPISPTLFVLALEPLLAVLKENVRGIPTPKGFFKVSAYADDVTVGLGELDDVNDIIRILNKFGKFSGLKINVEKCEILCLNGKAKHNETIQETTQIKITGIFFGDKKNRCKIEKMNFEPAIQTIRNKLNLWKMRALTLIGKVTVVKAHALSQIQFLASSLKTPNWVIKEIADMITNFIWNGRGKITKAKASKAWKEGGITIPLLNNLCKAASVKNTLRAKMIGEEALWASNLLFELEKAGGVAALHPQTDVKSLKKKGLPPYVLTQIEDWQALQKAIWPGFGKEITIYSPICFNKLLTAPSKLKSRAKAKLDLPFLLREGLHSVGQWFDPQADMIKWEEVRRKGIAPNAFFEWQKVRKTLKIAKIAIKNEKEVVIKEEFLPTFYTKKGPIRCGDISQKRILSEIAKNVEYIPNNTQIKISQRLSLEEDDLIKAFNLFKKDNPCTRKQEFQFKLLSGRVYTNKAYYGMGFKESAKCTFCSEEKQTLIHAYLDCEEVKKFRQQLSKDWDGDLMSEKRWFLGVSDTQETLEKCKNIIAKEANHYIFKMNWEGTKLSVEAFKNWLKSDEDPEEALALRINKIFDHHLKWSHLQVLLK